MFESSPRRVAILLRDPIAWLGDAAQIEDEEFSGAIFLTTGSRIWRRSATALAAEAGAVWPPKVLTFVMSFSTSPPALSNSCVPVSMAVRASSRFPRQMLSLSLMILLTKTAEEGSEASCLRIAWTLFEKVLTLLGYFRDIKNGCAIKIFCHLPSCFMGKFLNALKINFS